VPRNFVKPVKRNAARAQIERLIRDADLWGQRLVPERELAAELGVGRRTLRGALAELEADGLLERRQGAGTFVADRPFPSRRKRVARVLIIDSWHAESAEGWHYHGEMIRSLVNHSRRVRASCEVLALGRAEEAERIWDAKFVRGFDAVISVAQDAPDLLAHLLRSRRGPLVMLDHTIRDMPIVGVVDGSFEGARAVTRHLIGLGHRRIAFLDTWNREAINPWKYGGYRAGLADRRVAYDPDLVLTPEELGVSSEGSEKGKTMQSLARAAVSRLTDLPRRPTALLCFDDYRCPPLLPALEERGLVAGRNFALAGLGDSAFRRGVCDWLTSCRTYPRKMGRAALKAALETGRPDEGRTIIVPNRIMIRRSTCPPPP
jgi:DNA-binding LacI/PurR family transcriptional regulator